MTSSFEEPFREDSFDEINQPTNEDSWKDADFLSFEGNDKGNGEDDRGRGSASDMDVSADSIPPFDQQQQQQHQREGGARDGSLFLSQASGNEMEQQQQEQLPPWMDRAHDRRRVHPMTSLHNEIVQFCNLMEPFEEEIQQRQELLRRIEELIVKTFNRKTNKHPVVVKVFGSQATGLFLPTSDIDISVLTKGDDDDGAKGGGEKSETEKEESATTTTTKSEDSKDEQNKEEDDDEQDDWEAHHTQSPLHRLASALREHMLSELEYLEVIENTRVPLVKLTHAPTNISVDVSFDQPNGPKAAELMKTYLGAMPPLRPLTYVLKYFLASRGLNEPYTGGVGSFLLQLLIVAFLQHRERLSYNYRKQPSYNLGCLLLEFLEFYGVDFNYCTTGISVRYDGFFFPKGASDKRDIFWQAQRPFLLAFENPLDNAHDVGVSSFRIQTVQRAFAIAYRLLLAHVTPPVQPTESLLATILPPTEEMAHRGSMQRLRQRGSRLGLNSKRKQEQRHSRAGGSGGASNKRRRRQR